MLLQPATTNFCRVTMFEVGGNTYNDAFQLATQRDLGWFPSRRPPYSTCNATMFHCKLQQFVARITSPLNVFVRACMQRFI